MQHLYRCRRSAISFVGILCATYLGYRGATDAVYAIAGICAALSGANAWQARPISATARSTEVAE